MQIKLNLSAVKINGPFQNTVILNLLITYQGIMINNES